MADFIPLNPGAGGPSAAADEIAGLHYQRVKLIHGGDGVNDGDASTSNRYPVESKPLAGTLTDRSGTITTGATAQQIAAANPSRLGWCLQNLDPSSDLWVSSLANAVQSQPSIRISPGALYETPPGGQGLGVISVIGPTTGQAFTAREW